MSSNDFSLIEKIRKENFEQYLVLVRMHLSFVVDINTDDVDCSTDKPKQFRWNFHRKTKTSATNTMNSNNGKNFQEINSITDVGMARIYELIDFLSKEDNVKQEGVFRRTGSINRQQELRQLLSGGTSLGLEEGRFSVHDCASVLKGFLAEQPQPLLMDQYYQTYCTLAAQYPPSAETSETKLLTAIQLLLLLLTPLHRNFLQRLLTLLKVAADNEASNRMSPDTLATMFTPHLLCPRKLSPETFHTDSLALSPVVSFMIKHTMKLFEAPEQLATDVAAYFTIRERKRMMSPDIDLDESITDRTAANTVYTFVDRNRTCAENETNPTDAALAQLYAHIQALPDSRHKRRLVKQFNRQNGYGTPIQVQRTGKVAGSRSFGDSIKRHIFNKGLLNKTPKKLGSGSIFHTVEEKSSSCLSKEKLRFSNDEVIKTNEVSHKNIMIKNFATKIAGNDCVNDNEFDSDESNESTTSESGLLDPKKKHSPKFVSEPNLSVLGSPLDNETPKKKRGAGLFRSKMLSASQNINKKYQKRSVLARNTPTCVSCIDDQDTGTESDNSLNINRTDKENCLDTTPNKYESDCNELILKDPLMKEQINVGRINYLTSTPGMTDTGVFSEELCSTPYTVNFRRASMSPITKSTQKLSKAMQESIMTPRSRKPLIITSEQRDSLPVNTEKHIENTSTASRSSETVYQSLSPKNDSDFVSSDDDIMESKSSLNSYEHNKSNISAVRSENTRFVINNEKRLNYVEEDLNLTLCGSDDGVLLPKFKLNHDVSEISQKNKSLSEPFREYLLGRSVLTATPVDLSLLNKSNDTEEKISESLMYCLDGNVPSDLTSSINNLTVDKSSDVNKRSPLKNLVNIDSPNRKRSASSKQDHVEVEQKKVMIEKENVINPNKMYELRETDL